MTVPVSHRKEPSMPIIAHSSSHRYSQFSNRPGLQYLLRYALSHSHSAAWIAPLTRLLGKGGEHA
jgi:hypothetical protein